MASKENIEIIGDFKVDRNTTIGKGGQGYIYKGTCKHSGKAVAAKAIWIIDDDQSEIEKIQLEVKVHAKVKSHSNIVAFIDSKIVNDYLWIFTDFCQEGDLYKYCKNNTLDFTTKIDIMTQITEGIYYLHHLDPPIAHRDIKPTNVLVKKEQGKLKALLCDFGIAKCSSKEKTKNFETDCGT